MKIRQILKLMTLSTLCVVALSGCDSIKKSGVSGSEGRVVTLSDGRTVVVSGQKQAEDASNVSVNKKSEKKLAPPKDGKQNGKSKKNKKVKEQSSKADREKVDSIQVADKNSAKAESATSIDEKNAATVSDFSLSGEWTIYSVRGNEVTGEERPYITFDPAAGRFYGNNGCNYINGGLVLGEDNALKFDGMISTMKMCQNDQFQYLINLALADVVSYSAKRVKHETYLDMRDKSGHTIMVLRCHNMEFLNGGWMVTELNATPLVQEEPATMTFDTTDLRIHGTTGCNIFNGGLFIDPDKTTSLQVLRLITTRMACPADSRETEFLLALESVETAKAENGDTVILFDTEGKPLFKLVKMELKDDENNVK